MRVETPSSIAQEHNNDSTQTLTQDTNTFSRSNTWNVALGRLWITWSVVIECMNVCSAHVYWMCWLRCIYSPQQPNIVVGIEWPKQHFMRVYRTLHITGRVHLQTLSDCCCRYPFWWGEVLSHSRNWSNASPDPTMSLPRQLASSWIWRFDRWVMTDPLRQPLQAPKTQYLRNRSGASADKSPSIVLSADSVWCTTGPMRLYIAEFCQILAFILQLDLVVLEVVLWLRQTYLATSQLV